MRISDWSSDVCSSDLGFLGGRDLEDLGAQVRQVDHVAGPGGLVARAVAGVLERHPAVPGLRQRAHHPRVQFARPARLDRKSVVEGKRVSVSVDLGGRRTLKKKKNKRRNEAKHE